MLVSGSSRIALAACSKLPPARVRARRAARACPTRPLSDPELAPRRRLPAEGRRLEGPDRDARRGCGRRAAARRRRRRSRTARTRRRAAPSAGTPASRLRTAARSSASGWTALPDAGVAAACGRACRRRGLGRARRRLGARGCGRAGQAREQRRSTTGHATWPGHGSRAGPNGDNFARGPRATACPARRPVLSLAGSERPRWSPAERSAGGKSELHRTGCQSTAGGGDPEESATESRPPRRPARTAR